MSINVNVNTGRIFCAAICRDGRHCDRRVTTDGDICWQHTQKLKAQENK